MPNAINKIRIGFILSTLALTTPLFVGAVEDPPPTLQNPLNVDNIQDFLLRVLQIVIAILTPVVVLVFVYAGFLFVTAAGKEEKITKAKKAFLYAVIGAAVIFGAFILQSAISETIKSLTPPAP